MISGQLITCDRYLPTCAINSIEPAIFDDVVVDHDRRISWPSPCIMPNPDRLSGRNVYPSDGTIRDPTTGGRYSYADTSEVLYFKCVGDDCSLGLAIARWLFHCRQA